MCAYVLLCVLMRVCVCACVDMRVCARVLLLVVVCVCLGRCVDVFVCVLLVGVL